MSPFPAPRSLSDPPRASGNPLSLDLSVSPHHGRSGFPYRRKESAPGRAKRSIRLDDTDVGKRAMPIRVVQPVSHDPPIGAVEPEIIDPHVLLELRGLPQQPPGFQGGRLARGQDLG